MIEAALSQLEQEREAAKAGEDEVYLDLVHHYRGRLAALDRAKERPAGEEDQDFYAKFAALSLRLLGIERRTAVDLRNRRLIGDEVLRELERELDLGELKLEGRREE
jgi:hypothetical protein